MRQLCQFISVARTDGFRREDGKGLLPKMTTSTTHTIMAMIPPLDNVIDPESGPAAPAFESPALLPPELPTSPAVGPLPGCSGAEVASEEK